MTKSREKAGPVELDEKELGEIAGGQSTYSNRFTCIPTGVTANVSPSEQIAKTSAGPSTVKG